MMVMLEKKIPTLNPVEDFYVDVEWKNIKMLSVLVGKNGIGKSTVLKMMNYYFNRIQLDYAKKDKQLSYLIKTKENINISILLIHFDNNSMDLRSRDYTHKSYIKKLKLQPKNKELSFSNEIKKLEMDLIKITSIQSITSKEIEDLNNQGFILNFDLLKENQFEKKIEFTTCFPTITNRIGLLIAILNSKGIRAEKKFAFLPNIRRILIDNILSLEKINDLLNEFNFEKLIDVELKS